MSQANLRSHYLKAMEIDAYYLRGNSSSNAVPCYTYQMKSALQSVLLVAQMGEALEREELLFKAIAKAMGTETNIAIEDDCPDREKAQVLICLGEQVAAHYADADKIATHSLATLLTTPLLKAQTWQDIKKYCS